MQTTTLGSTGLSVSRLALGGLFISEHGGEFEQSRAAVHRAIELGINYIDTAPGYGNSEETLGKALADAPGPASGPLILSTKLGGRPQPFDPRDKDGLLQSVQTSLELLGRDVIDVLFIHEPDRPGEYDWFTDAEAFTGPVTELLDELKQKGVIRYTGLGGTTPYAMARIIDTGRFDVVLTAFNYSLLWREAERDVLPAAKRQGMGLVIGSPLQQGALAKRHDEDVRRGARWLSSPRRQQFIELYQLLDEAGMELPEMALRFVLSNPDVHTVLSGSRSVEEVEKNVAAAEKGPLPADILRRLDEIAATVPFRPFDEASHFPFGSDAWGPGKLR